MIKKNVFRLVWFLLILFGMSFSLAQVNGNKTKELKGVVLDDYGLPLVGADVFVKGTNIKSVTDNDGVFILKNVPSDANVTISFIGYETQKLKANSPLIKEIKMKKGAVNLGGVVVVGYGTQQKGNLTGAVSTISGKELNQRPVSSAVGALQGADPSVNISFNSGAPGAGHKINIRGVVSVNGGSPLVIVDGVQSSLSQINPNDIESVSVLKDASAAAIYGARASSGVIIITTKSGKTSGKTLINYSYRYGIAENTTSTDFIRTGYDHITLVNQFYKTYKGRDIFAYDNDDLKMLMDRRNDMTENPDRPWVTVDPQSKKYKYYGNFDWYGYFYKRVRPEQEHNISISGGNNKINYYASARYLQNDGVFNIYPDKFRNFSFRTKLDAKIVKWLKYSNNIAYNINDYKYTGDSDTDKTIASLQSNTSPVFVPRNPDGSIVLYSNQMNANSPLGSGYAGLLTADKNRNSRLAKQLTITNTLDAKLAKGLNLTAMYSYRNYNKLHKYRNNPFDYSRKEGEIKEFVNGSIYNEYIKYLYDSNLNSLNLYATYDHIFARDHHFKMVVGTQYETYKEVGTTLRQTNLISEALSSFALATGDAQIIPRINTYTTLGYFGRINYDYKSKYLLEVSGRYDGTSRFAPEHRWGLFPSFSLGWALSKENFWKPIKDTWNNAKLRFSYGSLGNQQVDYYSYIDLIMANKYLKNYTFDGKTQASYADVTDPKSSSLTWETVSMYNLGFDTGFLNNRLTLNADFFIRQTKDMLVPGLTLPKVFGAKTPEENAADLETRGYELVLSWNDEFKLAGKPFEYNISASLGDNKTKITRYNNPNKILSDYYEGQTLGDIWGYTVAGLFKTDQEAAEYQSQINDKAVNGRVYKSKMDNKLMAGDVRFVDLDGNKVINQGAGTLSNHGDLSIIGNTTPRYNYSFRLGANWNNFDLSVFLQGVGKRDWYPGTKAYDYWGPYSFPSLSFIAKDFASRVWSPENPDAYFPRPRGYQTYGGGALDVKNNRYMLDASYLRLKNVTFGYTLPVLEGKVTKIRVYFTGENLYYWSLMKKYTTTLDPELASTGDGLDYFYSKSYSLGVNINF